MNPDMDIVLHYPLFSDYIEETGFKSLMLYTTKYSKKDRLDPKWIRVTILNKKSTEQSKRPKFDSSRILHD